MKIIKAMVKSILLAAIVLANRLLMGLNGVLMGFNGVLLYIAAHIAGVQKKPIEPAMKACPPPVVYVLLAPAKPATTAMAKKIIENTCGKFTGYFYDMPMPDAKMWGYDVHLPDGHGLSVKNSAN